MDFFKKIRGNIKIYVEVPLGMRDMTMHDIYGKSSKWTFSKKIAEILKSMLTISFFIA